MNVRDSAETKRRDVFRAVVAYIVGAWLLSQIVMVTFVSFGAPNWLVRIAVVVLTIGCLLVLYLAAVFEITPEGIHRRVSLLDTFIASELECLLQNKSASRDEIFRFLITKAELTEEEVQHWMPESQARRWHETFAESITLLEECRLITRIGNACSLTDLGRALGAKRLTAINHSKLKRLASNLNRSLGRREAGLGIEDFILRRTAVDSNERADNEYASDASAEEEIKPRLMSVWFGTNRKPNDEHNPGMGFSRLPGDETSYGYCVVNIPYGHNLGQPQPPFWRRLLGEKGIVVKSIHGLPEHLFWATLDHDLGRSRSSQGAGLDEENRSMLLFIHGFNVSFVDAAIRTAQLKFDLGVDHAAFFSWPSLKLLWGYGGDSASAREATSHLAPFLTQLTGVTKDQGFNLHVVAHSMGNEAFLYSLERALLDLQGDTTKLQLAELIFAAPDVDARIFRDKATRTIATSRRRTLYASRRDRPLRLAEWLRLRRPRAGRIPPVTIVNQVDTVDVTRIDLSKLGHGYVAEARPVLADISMAMHFNAPPAKRFGLQATGNRTGRYWVIR